MRYHEAHASEESGMTTYENLTIEKNGSVATITFNRPDKANALDHAHLLDIENVALSFRDDPDTRAVVFTGKGKHFSSGADLSAHPDPVVKNA